MSGEPTGPLYVAEPGIRATGIKGMEFFQTFENHLDNRPYKVLIADGDWTCSVARWTGRMIRPVKGSDEKEMAPTGKSF